MGFTQPICTPCWFKEHPHVQPSVVEGAIEEVCCKCADVTMAGIYTHVDPDTVPFPIQED